MAKKPNGTMFLKQNVYYRGTELKQGMEINPDHEAYDEFNTDGFLVTSKALAENKPEAVANELDKSNRLVSELKAEIVALNNENSQLKADNEALVEELKKANKPAK